MDSEIVNTVGNFLPTKRIIFRLPEGEIVIEFVGSLITDRYGVHNEERRDLVMNGSVNHERSYNIPECWRSDWPECRI